MVVLPLLLGAGFELRDYLQKCPSNKICVALAPFNTTGDKTGQFVTKIKNNLDALAKNYPELQPSKSYEISDNETSESAFSDARRTGASLIFWGDFETAAPNSGAGTLVYGYRIFGLDSIDIPKYERVSKDSISEDDWKKSFVVQDEVKNKAVYRTKVVPGLAAWSRRKYADAVLRLSDALIHPPPDEERSALAGVYLFRGRAYAQQGMFVEAIQDYKSAIALDPLKMAAYQETGTAYFAQDLFDAAIKSFGDCIARNRHDTLAFDGRGLAYLRRATAAEVNANATSKDRDLASAESDFNKTIDIDSHYAPAFNHRGLLSLARGHQEDALRDFNAAIEINPKYTEAFENRGRALYQLRRWRESIEAYTLAIESSPSGLDIVALSERGAAHSATKAYEMAIADFTKVINCQPTGEQQCGSSKVALYVARGLAYAEVKRYDEALADFGQATLRDVNNANLYYNAGVLLKKMGEEQSALVNLSKAITLNPKLSQAYYERADLYKNEGQITKAIEDFQEFLNLATDADSKAGATYELESLKKRVNKGE
jgi:tetratricopeptide (TPR) repeat protein